MASRYDGKPFLRLLECYILSCIDQLSETDRRNLESMEPKLQSIYGVPGDWRQITASVVGFDGGLDTNSELCGTRTPNWRRHTVKNYCPMTSLKWSSTRISQASRPLTTDSGIDLRKDPKCDN